MGNSSLSKAKRAKNDEFYTQYADIQAEMNAYLEYNKDVFRDKTVLLPCDDPEWSNFTRYFAEHFEKFGLKKLISTGYATDSKNKNRADDEQMPHQITLFELNDPNFDEEKTASHGKIFVLDRDADNSGKIDISDLKWKYLEGDGDFRSDEVKKLRDEADIIVTNPPFSLFREFVAWIVGADKKFIIIGNKNAITYKEVFPLIKDNKMWLGPSITSGGRNFRVPNNYNESNNFIYDEEGNKYVNISGPRWFTNIDHGRRHQPLSLMTMADNIRFSKHKEIKGKEYLKYDNYNVIEIPFIDAIPNDYHGVMGVPVTFLDKYCPEQFEIIGMAEDNGKGFSGAASEWDGKNPHCVINGSNAKFKRIFIRKRVSKE